MLLCICCSEKEAAGTARHRQRATFPGEAKRKTRVRNVREIVIFGLLQCTDIFASFERRVRKKGVVLTQFSFQFGNHIGFCISGPCERSFSISEKENLWQKMIPLEKPNLVRLTKRYASGNELFPFFRACIARFSNHDSEHEKVTGAGNSIRSLAGNPFCML